MSDAEQTLTARDRAILDVSTQEESEQEAETTDGRIKRLESVVEDLQSLVEEQQETIDEHRREITRLHTARENAFDEIERIKLRAGDLDLSHLTIIERMARMVEDGHEVDGSMRRAICLHRNWEEWRRKLGTAGNQQWGVSTKMKSKRKYSPAYVRVKLEDELNESIASEQVRRALEMLAKKSVDDPDDVTVTRDTAKRLHITGGEYEFHEKTTPNNSDSTTYYVVVEA